MMSRWIVTALLTAVIAIGATATQPFADEKKPPELKDVIGVLPKFAIPMREVGDRFQNMYHAAKGGNWGLAFYMSKYMNGAMNPAKITKPDEYPMWSGFYESSIEPINKAIMAKDFAAFEKTYAEAITGCNTCHAGMGYAFIQVHRLKAPPDPGLNYTLKSKGEDVPK
jgi:uncharacterized membrane protein